MGGHITKSTGRGLDFEQRFNTSRWAEDVVFKSTNTQEVLPIRLGASKVSDVVTRSKSQIEVKEPDILLLNKCQLSKKQSSSLAERNYDLTDIDPSVLLNDKRWIFVRNAAIAALEVEFSPYKATEMKQRHWNKRAKGSARRIPKVAKPPIAPNIWIKREDVSRLVKWEELFSVPISVIHVFDQEAFVARLRSILQVVSSIDKCRGSENKRKIQLETGVFVKEQNYNRTDQEGAGERKQVIVVAPCASVCAGRVVGVRVASQLGISKSGKYVSHVIFKGGKLKLECAFWDTVMECDI